MTFVFPLDIFAIPDHTRITLPKLGIDTLVGLILVAHEQLLASDFLLIKCLFLILTSSSKKDDLLSRDNF